METVEAARTTIQNYLNRTIDDESEVIAAIDELSYVDMDIELIRNTGIGRVIRKLSKDKRSATVGNKAKQLENKLKQLVEAPTATPEKRPRTSSSTTAPENQSKKRNVQPDKAFAANSGEKTPEKPNIERKISNNNNNNNSPNRNTNQLEPDSNFKGETNNVARNLVQTKIYQALAQSSVLGGSEPSRVAVGIETCMYNKFGDAKHKDYQAKYRSLWSNLKDPLNDGLRSALFTGDLSVDTLIGMSHEELANPTLQQERKKLKLYQQEARRGDRHMRDATCSMFTCNKCGQNKTTYFQLQTRSADEPMTTFVTCCNCGHHWKF